MRYKGKLTPSFLLCPETYRWVPIEKCITKLDVKKYSKLVDGEDETDEDMCSSRDVDDIRVLCNRRVLSLKQFKRIYDEDIFGGAHVGALIGKTGCNSLIFIAN